MPLVGGGKDRIGVEGEKSLKNTWSVVDIIVIL
jgi:hypothetical protein